MSYSKITKALSKLLQLWVTLMDQLAIRKDTLLFEKATK